MKPNIHFNVSLQWLFQEQSISLIHIAIYTS